MRNTAESPGGIILSDNRGSGDFSVMFSVGNLILVNISLTRVELRALVVDLLPGHC